MSLNVCFCKPYLLLFTLSYISKDIFCIFYISKDIFCIFHILSKIFQKKSSFVLFQPKLQDVFSI